MATRATAITVMVAAGISNQLRDVYSQKRSNENVSSLLKKKHPMVDRRVFLFVEKVSWLNQPEQM